MNATETKPVHHLAAAIVPHEARQVLVVVNRKAGRRSRGSLLEQCVALLKEQRMDVELCWDLEQLVEKVVEASASRQLRAVVAAGGDGTISMLANLMPVGTPLMVVPMGTENLMARYLGIVRSARLICRTIGHGVVVRLDAGQANGRLFLLMAGLGLDAEVVRRLHEVRRGNIDYFSYAKPIVGALRSYQYPPLRISCSAGHVVNCPAADLGRVEQHSTGVTITARWAFAVNLPRYALGLGIAPAAVATDGLLDVCTFHEGRLWHGLRYLGGIMLRRHETWRDCVTLRTTRLRVEADGAVPLQLDGDPAGFLPADIEVLPRRLTMLVPWRWAHQYGFRLASTPPEA